MVNIQKELDAFAYPPTMTYDIKTMEPTRVLKQRVDLINQHFPNFFKGKRLLDVGSNKGFFSFKYSNNFIEVHGIDLDKTGIDISNKINKLDLGERVMNTTFEHVSFCNFMTDNTEYDKIFIANTAHHIYKESNGWDWIHKLAVLSTGEVLLEMPTGMECIDMPDVFKGREDLQKTFNEVAFKKAIEPYFELVYKTPTVDYTPDRYLILLRRKHDGLQNKYQLENLEMIRSLKGKEDSVHLVNNKTINGEQVYKKLQQFSDKLGLSLASTFYNNTKITGFVYDKGKLVGHIEEFNTADPHSYKQKEKEIFKRHCNENLFLLKFGYINLYPATLNYFTDSLLGFDKSLVLKIEKITKYSPESYEKMFNNSYEAIPDHFSFLVKEGLKSKKQNELIKIFTSLKKQFEVVISN